MAKAAGVSHRSVQRIWAAHDLKPHRVRTFKLSKDPQFAAKLQDIVGLYMDPPEHARHPRFHFHFTPTSASWLNAVEGFFAKLTNRRLRRGTFSGIVDLQAAINRFLAETNQCPKPFVWIADPDGIIEKVRRGRAALASVG
jgi:transposase